MTFPSRVAERAAEVKLTRVLLTVLAAPFYVVGLVLGVVWVAVLWLVAAVALGVADARRRGQRAPESEA